MSKMRNRLIVGLTASAVLFACRQEPADLRISDITSRVQRPIIVVTDDASSVGVAFASIEVQCKNGNKFKLSTGTDGGACAVSLDENENVTGGNCGDAGNGGEGSAKVSCTANGGAGACTETTGKGSCEQVKE